jgi:8-oxo-dGTP pyrophosphatase MutT (NUDIX family)
VAESLRRLCRPHGDHGRTRTGTVACVHDLDVIPRRAARVLLVDARNRLLLLHGFNPSAPAELFWFTIGGGIDPGDSAAAAAARELLEEAGLAVDPADLGEPVWHRIAEFSFDGRHYRQEEDYFLLPWSHSRSASRAWTRSSRRQSSATAGGKSPACRPLARRSSQANCPGCYAS